MEDDKTIKKLNNEIFGPRIMMSINPKQVERIKTESQSVILHKIAAPDFDDGTEFKVYIYETSPLKRVIGNSFQQWRLFILIL